MIYFERTAGGGFNLCVSDYCKYFFHFVHLLIALLHTKYDNVLHIIEKCLKFFIFFRKVNFCKKKRPENRDVPLI